MKYFKMPYGYVATTIPTDGEEISKEEYDEAIERINASIPAATETTEEEPLTAEERITILEDTIKTIMDVPVVKSYFDGLKVVVTGEGTYTNPYQYVDGITVMKYTIADVFSGDGFYAVGGLVKRCIKDGVPTSFDDEEYFTEDFI